MCLAFVFFRDGTVSYPRVRVNQSGSSTSALEWLGSLDPFSLALVPRSVENRTRGYLRPDGAQNIQRARAHHFPTPRQTTAMAATARTLAASVSLAARPVAAPRRAAARAPARSASVVVKAEGATAEATDVYEVTLPKSVALQLKFARGNDGGAYCVFVPDETEFDAFEIGDKILAKEDAELDKLGIQYTRLTPENFKRVKATWNSSLWDVANKCCGDGAPQLRELARKAGLTN